jgi:predicted membrane channel-forming protein YqfA (hemolysin III family)
MSTIIVVNPRFQSSRWRTLRISTFVAMGFSALLPMVHAASIYPYAQLHQQTDMGYYLVEGMALIIGTVFYAVSWGEWHATHAMGGTGGRDKS